MMIMRFIGVVVGMMALSLMGMQDALTPAVVSNSYARVRGRLMVRPVSPLAWPVVTVVEQLPVQNVHNPVHAEQPQPVQAAAQPQPAAVAMGRINRLMGHLRS